MLVKQGADVDAVHSAGAMLLHLAALNGHVEATKTLVAPGAH
jgi:ankyrin repeat protein